MQLSLECPTKLLEQIQPFADFDFILADLVLKDEAYRNYYKASDRVKIVDNSVNELGQPLPLAEIIKAFKEVNGTYLVAPDFLGKAQETINSYLSCCKEIGKEKTIGVLQGSSFEEVFTSLSYYQGLIAIPFDICSSKEDPPWLMGLRRALVVSRLPSESRVHLLGFNSIEEFFWYKNLPSVVSIDTGVPIMLGLQEKDILDPLEDKKTPTLLKMDEIELTQKNWTAICRNLALLRKYIG